MNATELHARLLARLASAGVAVAASEIDQLEAYYRLLRRWNATINLTALLLEPLSDDALDRLFVEPLAAAKYVSEANADWVDLGSGGGSPAIPLKIMRPGLNLTMVEARERKAAFLREVARELNLTGTTVATERFETLANRPDFAGLAALVTVRAVKVDSNLLRNGRRLLLPEGKLFLFGFHPGLDVTAFQSAQAVELIPGGSPDLLILSVGVENVPRET